MEILNWLAGLLVLSPLAAVGLILLIPQVARLPLPVFQSIRASTRRLQDGISISASLFSFVLALGLASTVTTITKQPNPQSVFGVQFYLDALSVYFVLLVNVIALVASFYVGYFLDSQGRLGTDSGATAFHVLFNFFHFTMVVVPMMDNLVVLWIAVELTTVASTLLIGFRRDHQALEAAWKYIIITSTGIILALLGTIFLANAIPPKAGMNWSELVRISTSQFNAPFVTLSFLFVLVGYGTKAGFAPMHTWLPDGHGEAPFPVSALLSGVLLKCALYAILRFYTITNLALGDQAAFTSVILLGSGILSLVLATPFILKDNKFKRVLAYHSLEHMGIITFGLGIGTSLALFGALLHALNHALTKALMFLAFGNVQTNYAEPGLHEENYVGILRSMPVTGYILALGGLALVGSPPFNIFLSEFMILWAAISSAIEKPSIWVFFAIALFLISTTVIFGGLVRHLGRMLLGARPAGVRITAETLGQVFPLVILFAAVLVFGLVIPAIPLPIFGSLDLPKLLDQSVCIVQTGQSLCH